VQKEVNREYRAVKSKKGKRAFNCMFWAFFRGFVQGEAELDEKGKEEEERHEWRRRFSGKNNAKKGCFLAIYWLDLEKKGDSGGGITPGRTFSSGTSFYSPGDYFTQHW